MENGGDVLGREEEHPEGDLDGDQREEDLERSHKLDGKVEALDFVLVFLDEFGREDVRPELKDDRITPNERKRLAIGSRGGAKGSWDMPCRLCRTKP
jgi:hypothetical protein